MEEADRIRIIPSLWHAIYDLGAIDDEDACTARMLLREEDVQQFPHTDLEARLFQALSSRGDSGILSRIHKPRRQSPFPPAGRVDTADKQDLTILLDPYAHSDLGIGEMDMAAMGTNRPQASGCHSRFKTMTTRAAEFYRGRISRHLRRARIMNVARTMTAPPSATSIPRKAMSQTGQVRMPEG